MKTVSLLLLTSFFAGVAHAGGGPKLPGDKAGHETLDGLRDKVLRLTEKVKDLGEQLRPATNLPAKKKQRAFGKHCWRWEASGYGPVPFDVGLRLGEKAFELEGGKSVPRERILSFSAVYRAQDSGQTHGGAKPIQVKTKYCTIITYERAE
jgi:hypothetical protein